jgi:4-amino-4-deoxy-L-arabinose transferase-like glycosyltransferase
MRFAELFLDKWGFWILAAAAVAYYGLYFDCGLMMTGEQGSNALIAMRILEGERPFVDLFTGYNLLWFYPITGLFAVLGPHWLAMRICFLLLAVVTALMGYSLVRRVTGQAWLALIAGFFMTLMPGAIFRNYMGFIGVFASMLLVRAYVLEAASQRRQIALMILAGAGLSLCFLIRIEPSLFISVVWAGLVLLYPFAGKGHFAQRFRTALLGTLGGLLAFAAVHAPFVADAYYRGFGPQFTGQYTRYVDLLQWELEREWEHWTSRKIKTIRSTSDAVMTGASPSRAGDASNQTLQAPPGEETSGRDGRRAIVPISEIFSGGRIYFFAAGLWLPVVVASVLVLSGTVLLVVSLISGHKANKTRSLVVLTTTGCALSLFPQYFFFRPDSVHLNEFLVPFWPASLCSAWVLLQAANESGSRVARLWAWIVAVLVALLFVVSFNALFGREGSGSIISARGADTSFKALNGVQAKVRASEISDWEGLRDAVAQNSAPGEFVVTYPYVPIVNVMCDRPTYQWSLYVDNATASASFEEKEGAILRERKPAVIVINNRAINKTEESRFRNWASELYTQIRHDYDLVGNYFEEVEVFALRARDIRNMSPGETAR